MTQAELSAASGVPASTISKIEKEMYGDVADRYSGMFARALSMPVSYFTDEPLPDVPDGRYRKQSKASVKLQKAVVAHAKQAAAVMDVASKLYRIIKPSIEPLGDKVDPELHERYASKLRDIIGVGQDGPIRNMTRSCEKAGVVVVNLPIFEDASRSKDVRRFSGFSTWPTQGADPKKRPIVLLSSSLPGDVQRASLAHELAHLYIHTRNPGIDYADAERQAWMVGGEILVPLHEAREALGDVPVTLERLRRLKLTYGVSVKFLITYCSRNGLIDKERATSLHKQYSSRRWNKAEPVEVDRESARFFPMVITRMRRDGIDIGMPRMDVAYVSREGAMKAKETSAGGQVVVLGKRVGRTGSART